MNRFLAGALGGLVATVPMTMTMLACWKRLPKKDQYPVPPREITEQTVCRLSTEAQNLSDKRLAELSLSAHFAYGAATGALYPIFTSQPRRPVVFGAGYGIGIWGASYLGWIPAARILKPATQHPPARNYMMIASHLVWGAATVWIGETLRASRATGHQPRARLNIHSKR